MSNQALMSTAHTTEYRYDRSRFAGGSMNRRGPAVFLDRDGVINENRTDHVKSWEEFSFIPGALDALRALARHCQNIVIISNQSIVGRGIVGPEVVRHIHENMAAHIEGRGGRVDAIYYCPHHPDAGCDCRKPKTGLLRRAARELGIDLSQSYFVGDALSDVEAGLRAGCQPILVRTGRGQETADKMWDRGYVDVPLVNDLAQAADQVLHSVGTAGVVAHG